MIRIESASNTIFKQTKKLLTTSGRKKSGMFIIEGGRIVRDAISYGADIEYIIINDSYYNAGNGEFSVNKLYVFTDKLFDELKTTVNSQGIMAVVRYIDSPCDEINYTKGRYVYLDSVTDPGNMGTIIRSAAAFGIDGIILSGGCVDVFNPKVLRSTMSGIFSVKIFFDTGDVLSAFRDSGFKIIGTFLTDANPSHEFDYTDSCVIVMGNEANGISPQVEKMCTKRVTIPMTDGAESLNVSVACGILLYESYVSLKGENTHDEF